MHRIRPFAAAAGMTVAVACVLFDAMPTWALVVVSAVAGVMVYWWLRRPDGITRAVEQPWRYQKQRRRTTHSL